MNGDVRKKEELKKLKAAMKPGVQYEIKLDYGLSCWEYKLQGETIFIGELAYAEQGKFFDV